MNTYAKIVQALLEAIPYVEKILKGLSISKTETEKAIENVRKRLLLRRKKSGEINEAIKKAKDNSDTSYLERILNRWK